MRMSKADNRLILLGTKGGPKIGPDTAWPTSNILVVEGHPYLIDAGLGVTRQVWKAGFNPADIERIFITHHHADHNMELGGFVHNAWISGVVKERDELRKKRDATYKKLQELNKFNSAEEKVAFQCRKSARAVRDLVEKGDFEAAQEAANAQVEKWISECWNSAEYRKEYVKLHSQRSRQRFRGEVEAEVDKELGIEGFTSGSSGPIMTDKVKESIKSKAKREVDALLAQAARGAKSNA